MIDKIKGKLNNFEIELKRREIILPTSIIEEMSINRLKRYKKRVFNARKQLEKEEFEKNKEKSINNSPIYFNRKNVNIISELIDNKLK